MAREPILSRELHFSRARNSGLIYFQNYALVNTSLGAMVESRSFSMLPENGAPIDMVDAGVDNVTEINTDEMSDTLGTSGLNVPYNFARNV